MCITPCLATPLRSFLYTLKSHCPSCAAVVDILTLLENHIGHRRSLGYVIGDGT